MIHYRARKSIHFFETCLERGGRPACGWEHWTLLQFPPAAAAQTKELRLPFLRREVATPGGDGYGFPNCCIRNRRSWPPITNSSTYPFRYKRSRHSSSNVTCPSSNSLMLAITAILIQPRTVRSVACRFEVEDLVSYKKADSFSQELCNSRHLIALARKHPRRQRFEASIVTGLEQPLFSGVLMSGQPLATITQADRLFMPLLDQGSRLLSPLPGTLHRCALTF
jgi:hypothetical protein